MAQNMIVYSLGEAQHGVVEIENDAAVDFTIS